MSYGLDALMQAAAGRLRGQLNGLSALIFVIAFDQPVISANCSDRMMKEGDVIYPRQDSGY